MRRHSIGHANMTIAAIQGVAIGARRRDTASARLHLARRRLLARSRRLVRLPLALGHLKGEDDRPEIRAETKLEPSAQAPGESPDDPQSLSLPTARTSGTVVRHNTINYPLPVRELDRDVPAPRFEAGMFGDVGHELVDNQSQAPASLWLERQRLALERELDVQPIEQRNRQSRAKPSNIHAGIDQRLRLRHP